MPQQNTKPKDLDKMNTKIIALLLSSLFAQNALAMDCAVYLSRDSYDLATDGVRLCFSKAELNHCKLSDHQLITDYIYEGVGILTFKAKKETNTTYGIIGYGHASATGGPANIMMTITGISKQVSFKNALLGIYNNDTKNAFMKQCTWR